jgi:transporter family-2 protein
MLLDHFGLFGLVEKQLTLPRLFGAVLLIAGVVLIQFGNSPGRVLAPQ